MRRIPPQQQFQYQQQSPFTVSTQSPFSSSARSPMPSSSLVPVRPANMTSGALMPVQMQISHMMNPFQHMQQMMTGFGGLQEDPMIMGMMMMALGGDPFEDMFNFSDIHKNVHNRGIEGSYVSQSFMSSAVMGPDGQIIRENYYENNMGEHRGGQTISQKQQAYRNTDGLNRIAEQRMLNDRGRKIVRQKRGNDVQETMHYYNIDEEEATTFDNDWRRADQNMKFLENHQRYLQMPEQPPTRGIGSSQSSQPMLSIGYHGQTTQVITGQQPTNNTRSNMQFSHLPQRTAVTGQYPTAALTSTASQNSVRFNSGAEIRPQITGSSLSVSPSVPQTGTYQHQVHRPTLINYSALELPQSQYSRPVHSGIQNNNVNYNSPISSSPLATSYNNRSIPTNAYMNQGNAVVIGMVSSPISSLRSSKLSAAESINSNESNNNIFNNINNNNYMMEQNINNFSFKKTTNTDNNINVNTNTNTNTQPEIKEDRV